HDAKGRSAPFGARDLGLKLCHEPAAVRKPRQLIGDRLLLYEAVEARVLECNLALTCDPLRRLARLPVEDAFRSIELERGGDAFLNPDRHLEPLGSAARSALRARDAARRDRPTRRTCRLGRRLEDHRQKRIWVVRRGERLADDRQRIANVRPPPAAPKQRKAKARERSEERREQDPEKRERHARRLRVGEEERRRRRRAQRELADGSMRRERELRARALRRGRRLDLVADRVDEAEAAGGAAGGVD